MQLGDVTALETSNIMLVDININARWATSKQHLVQTKQSYGQAQKLSRECK